MILIAIDPGPAESAFAVYDQGSVLHAEKVANGILRQVLVECRNPEIPSLYRPDRMAYEMVESFGMAVGREIFETVLWTGRFIEAWGGPAVRVTRKEVKIHLCNSMKARDTNIRAALIDRYGPGKDKAIGTKKAPGPLYGISGDCWSALAVAVTAEAQVRAVLEGCEAEPAAALA